MKTIRFLILLFLASNIVSAENDEASFSKISAILFPETASWTLVSNMKHADSAFLRNNEAKLREAYLSSKLMNKEDISCSFIDRVFSSDYGSPKYFYIHDIDHDGIDDILYTGTSPCSEGNATVIWFGTPQGFEIRQDYFWYALAIRISEGKQLQISSVAVGCCGEIIDDYMCGKVINLRCEGIQRFYHMTELPPLAEERSRKTAESFVSKKELTLRSTPEINDNYIDGFSQLLGRAVFGNILSKYMKGCKAEIIGNIIDKHSRKWYFVVIDNKSKALRTHVPFDVCAGWISSDNIN